MSPEKEKPPTPILKDLVKSAFAKFRQQTVYDSPDGKQVYSPFYASIDVVTESIRNGVDAFELAVSLAKQATVLPKEMDRSAELCMNDHENWHEVFLALSQEIVLGELMGTHKEIEAEYRERCENFEEEDE